MWPPTNWNDHHECEQAGCYLTVPVFVMKSYGNKSNLLDLL